MSIHAINRSTLTELSSDPRAVLGRYWIDLDAARGALARNKTSAIALTARGLLTALASARVQDELEHAAEAFAEGTEERPDAEQWITFAVAARATLECAHKRGAELANELYELDQALEHTREAVLMLEPEDYNDALAGMPPKKSAWWGERARLDAGVREIDLERALGELADSPGLLED